MLAVSSLSKEKVEDRGIKVDIGKRVNEALPLPVTLCLNKQLLTHQTPTFNLTRKEERKAKGRRVSKPRTNSAPEAASLSTASQAHTSVAMMSQSLRSSVERHPIPAPSSATPKLATNANRSTTRSLF